MGESLQRRAAMLQKQFEEASSRWPSFESVLILWPESTSPPAIPRHLRPPGPTGDKFCALYDDDCDLLEVGVPIRLYDQLKLEAFEEQLSLHELCLAKLREPVFGAVERDSPKRRFFPGKCSEYSWWVNADRLPEAASSQPSAAATAANNALYRWQTLAGETEKLFEVASWHSGIGWLIQVHRCTLNPRRLPDGDAIYNRIPDLFLASSLAIDALLIRLDRRVSKSPSVPGVLAVSRKDPRGRNAKLRRNLTWLEEWEADPPAFKTQADFARAKKVAPPTMRAALAAARRHRSQNN